MEQLAKVTITHRTVTRDQAGNELVTVTGETEYEDVPVAPRPEEPAAELGEEVRRYRTIIVVGYSVFLPPDAVVGTDDRLLLENMHPQVDGMYFVDGLPAVWVNPFTEDRPGVVVAVRRVKG